MTAAEIAAAGIVLLFVLIILHVPLAFALIAVGIAAFAIQTNWSAAITYLASEPAVVLTNVDFASVPLFLMMGAFVTISGFSNDLYVAAAAMLGHRKGGLAYSTLAGSAAFGAVCGSSTATAATFTRVALPEMLARGYMPSFSGATIAAGGALKALIPPSLSMIIYCVVAKVFIFDLFVAAVIPAILTLCLNMLVIAVMVRIAPDIAPTSDRLPWRERVVLIARASPALLLIAVVFVSLYSGIFTVNEAASVAAVVSFFFALSRRRLTYNALYESLIATALVVGMLYFILIGAAIFTYFVNIGHLPDQLIYAVGNLDVPPLAIVALLLVFYLALGAVFDEMAAMIVTLPLVLPIIIGLGFDPVWWGVINVVIIELGLIIPPVGVVILIVNTMVPQISLSILYRSVMPFIAADMIALALLTIFPALSLWLPKLLKMM